MNTRVSQILRFGAMMLAVLDGAMKSITIERFPSEAEHTLSPIIAFALHKNPGIAFDIPIPIWIIILLSIVFISVLAERSRATAQRLPAVSLAFFSMAIGALSNLLDRILHGFTTDYIILFRTSAINISDVLIVLGAIGLLRYTHNNPNAFQTLFQGSPSWYGIISRPLVSIVRFIRNTRHR